MSWWKKLLGIKESSVSPRIDWLHVEGQQRAIDALMAQNNQLAFKQAIIDYDKLVDSILKQLAVGNTFADRLKSLRSRLPRELYDQLWRAHIKRNELVHDTGSFVADWELTAHIRSYRESVSALRGISIR